MSEAVALAGMLAEVSPNTLSILVNTMGVSGPEGLGQANILGYHMSQDAASVVVWIVTVGKLIRVEVSEAAALAITWPIERVSRMSELYTANGYVLSIELDADARTLVEGRDEPTRYDVVAPHGEKSSSAQSFARALSAALGS